MKNKSTKKLIVLGVLALFILATQNASAYVPGVWEPQPPRTNIQPAFTSIPTGNEVKLSSNIDDHSDHDHNHDVNSNNTNTIRNTNTNQNTKSFPSNNTTRTTTVQRREVMPVQNSFNVVNSQGINGGIYPNANNPENNNNLTALSLRGSGGFMPSSIWQWLLVVLLILVIIIIARMLGRKNDHHEVHKVTSH